MVAEFNRDRVLQAEFESRDPPLLLKADHVVHLVRLAREALVNAEKHGCAQHAWLTCSGSAGQGELVVQDDGSGFRADESPQDGQAHFGLRVMRARAARIGGVLLLDSQPGQGACVRVTWPMETE
jgi:two-component system, NarL family, nitrate/nitrite sensor histidine kinase NarX